MADGVAGENGVDDVDGVHAVDYGIICKHVDPNGSLLESMESLGSKRVNILLNTPHPQFMNPRSVPWGIP